MNLFDPQLSITISPDRKSFVVHATVAVPDGSYLADGTSDTAPDGTILIPEAQPLQLRIKKVPGPATQAIKLLSFARRFPFSQGKWSIVAFVMLDDLTHAPSDPVLVGKGSIAIPHAPEMASFEALAVPAAASSGAWVAPGEVGGWIDTMPGPATWTMHLRVGMWAPTGGYKYKLIPKGPFGITGSTILCEMQATRPTGMVIQVLTHTTVPVDEPIKVGDPLDSILVVFEGNSYLGPLKKVS